jgi:hypothetical protein
MTTTVITPIRTGLTLLCATGKGMLLVVSPAWSICQNAHTSGSVQRLLSIAASDAHKVSWCCIQNRAGLLPACKIAASDAHTDGLVEDTASPLDPLMRVSVIFTAMVVVTTGMMMRMTPASAGQSL